MVCGRSHAHAFLGVIFLLLSLKPNHRVWAVAGRSGSKGRLYDILGVSSLANENDIKKAHRRLAMKWHPDRNRGNEQAAAAKFKEVQQAYEVLSDPSKKQVYDVYGEEGLKAHEAGAHSSQGGQTNGFGGGSFQSEFSPDVAEMLADLLGQKSRHHGFQQTQFSQNFDSGDSSGFSGFFSQMFGGQGENPFESSFGRSNAQEREFDVTVSLEDLYARSSRVVSVPHRIRQRGQPFTYTYKHSYPFRLKSWWRDGTKLKFPAMQVTLRGVRGRCI
jgi:DnaJ homolog subfamily B member 4